MDSDVLNYYDGRERSLPRLSLPYGVLRRDYPEDMYPPRPGFQFVYNTPITSPYLWDAYSAWARRRGDDPVESAFDYDMQGAFLREAAMTLDERVAEAVDPRGHGSDTFKKPNHSSFSAESVYASPLHPGGEWKLSWNGQGYSMPRPDMPNFMPPRETAEYMWNYEPGEVLRDQAMFLPRLMFPNYYPR